ncbi:N-acetyl sugar amidotransferase [Gammaproteobacteria bacterium]|nr:N-acetyl sugar amidotransferase [Gammaproteobacteria bacterium]
MVTSCPKCLYNNAHPFGLSISETECSGCITHKEKDILDWDNRRTLLDDSLKRYRTRGRKYDCVVPVIGDAEDYYTLSKVIELGLSPLVVCVNDYFKNDIGWHNLHQLITYFDVDSFVFNPDIRVYKELVKTSLRKYSHVLLPFLQLHSSFPVHVAFERKIPLVIWGQNQAVEQVGKFSHIDAVEMSRWSRQQHDLFETDVDELIGNGAQVDSRYLNYYTYPSISRLEKRGVTGLYLSNYFRWDPLHQNSSMKSYGFQSETNFSSFDIYERAGSSIYYKLHDLLKFKRTGYRKITDHLVREIRHGRIDKNLALKIEKIYTDNPVNIKPFFDWLGASKSGYEWFKMHRLKGLEHIITESNEKNPITNLPESIKSLIHKSKKSQKDYLFFYKGIDI